MCSFWTCGTWCGTARRGDLTGAWDGHGMAATQSHALRFADFPATRIAWPGHVPQLMEGAGGHNQSCAAVIVGIVETALEAARQQVARRRETLRAYERVEWTKAEQEGWLIQQAYEGMLRAVEADRDGRRNAVQGKMAIAALAEAATGRICRSARWGDIHPFLTLRALVRRRCGRSGFCGLRGGWRMTISLRRPWRRWHGASLSESEVCRAASRWMRPNGCVDSLTQRVPNQGLQAMANSVRSSLAPALRRA